VNKLRLGVLEIFLKFGKHNGRLSVGLRTHVGHEAQAIMKPVAVTYTFEMLVFEHRYFTELPSAKNELIIDMIVYVVKNTCQGDHLSSRLG
jgi:hypothetical protein